MTISEKSQKREGAQDFLVNGEEVMHLVKFVYRRRAGRHLRLLTFRIKSQPGVAFKTVSYKKRVALFCSCLNMKK